LGLGLTWKNVNEKQVQLEDSNGRQLKKLCTESGEENFIREMGGWKMPVGGFEESISVVQRKVPKERKGILEKRRRGKIEVGAFALEKKKKGDDPWKAREKWRGNIGRTSR